MDNQGLNFPDFDGLDLQALAEGREPNGIVKSVEAKKEEEKEEEHKEDNRNAIDPVYKDLDLTGNDAAKKEEKEKSNYEIEGEEADAAKAAEALEAAKADMESNTDADVDTDVDSDDPIVVKFQEALDFGTFIVPEDFKFDGSEEKFNEAVELTQAHYAQEAETSLTSSIQDPKLKEIVDYGIKGGKFADIESFGQYQQIQNNFETADLTDEDVQKEVMRSYYQTTAGSLGADKINKLVDEEVDSGKLKEAAEQAQQWFINETTKEKTRLATEAKGKLDAEKEASKVYNQNFQKALNETKFQDNKKREIVGSFDQVKLEDGQELLKWHYNLMQVQSNPSHFIELLDILNTYNEEKGFNFTKIKNKVKTEETKSLFDKFKGNNESAASGSRVKKEQAQTGLLRNPVDRYVKKLR